MTRGFILCYPAGRMKKVRSYFSITVFLLLGLIFSLLLSQQETAVFASTISSLNPVADTYVFSKRANTNFGTRNNLQVDGSPIKIGYLRFDLASLAGENILSAKLRLRLSDSSVSSQNVKLVADDNWSETVITYNDRPALGAVLNTFPGGTAGTWVEIDLTSAVANEAGQLFSIGIDSSGGDGLKFYSKEASSNKPVLVVEYGQATPTPTPSPTPTPPPGTDPIVVAAGDIACDTNTSTSTTCQQQATSDLVLQIAPSAVLALGDLQYNSGAYQDFLDFFDPSWGRFKNLINPVPGNHEYGTAGAAGYFDYFNGIGNFTGPAGDRDKGYYSFDIGDWHIISLNSNCSQVGGCEAGSPQEQWLRQDLASHSNFCTLAFWHHSYYTSGTRGWTMEVKPLVQALYDLEADLLLVGHNHYYERFAPQDPEGNLDTVRGIREIIVGTGGKEVLNLGENTYPNREVRDTSSFGVLKVTLRPTAYDWEFVPVPGYPFTDSGSTSCH